MLNFGTHSHHSQHLVIGVVQVFTYLLLKRCCFRKSSIILFDWPCVLNAGESDGENVASRRWRFGAVTTDSVINQTLITDVQIHAPRHQVMEKRDASQRVKKTAWLLDASLVQGSLSTYSLSDSAMFDRSRPKSWKSKSCLQHFLHDHRKMTGTWCFLIFESKDQVFAHSLFFQASFRYLRRKLQ